MSGAPSAGLRPARLCQSAMTAPSINLLAVRRILHLDVRRHFCQRGVRQRPCRPQGVGQGNRSGLPGPECSGRRTINARDQVVLIPPVAAGKSKEQGVRLGFDLSCLWAQSGGCPYAGSLCATVCRGDPRIGGDQNAKEQLGRCHRRASDVAYAHVSGPPALCPAATLGLHAARGMSSNLRRSGMRRLRMTEAGRPERGTGWRPWMAARETTREGTMSL